MADDAVLTWVRASSRRVAVLTVFDQPLSATHVAARTGLRLVHASFVLGELLSAQLLQSLTLHATGSRILWLTRLGERVQRALRGETAAGPPGSFPIVDFHLLSLVSFSHRSAVLRTLDRPLQATEIRKRSRLENPTQRMNSSNVRDVLGVFRRHGLVVPVRRRKRSYPKWSLSEVGVSVRELLVGATTRSQSYRSQVGRMHGDR
jgi:hypothetical protein